MKPRPSMVRGFLFLAFFAILYTCSGTTALAQTVQVTSADPPAAEQGTVSLDVTIKGKGFKQGAMAQWFVTGTTNPGGVTVNSTDFVSANELRANITIADDATIANFDIQVQNSNGRSGKGTELFSVVAKGSTTTGEPGIGLIAGFEDDSLGDPVAGTIADRMYSDCGLGFDNQGNHFCPYVDDVDFVSIKFFDVKLEFNTNTTNRKEVRRVVRLTFPEPTVCFDSNCQPMDNPLNGELFWPARIRFGLVGVNSFEEIPVGLSVPAKGGIFLDQVERNLNYIIRFQPQYATADGFNCANSTRVMVTRAETDVWELEAVQQDLACLEEQHLKQGKQDFFRVNRGYLKLPFKIVLRRLH